MSIQGVIDFFLVLLWLSAKILSVFISFVQPDSQFMAYTQNVLIHV